MGISREVFDRILHSLIEGETIVEILKDEGVSRQAFYNAIWSDPTLEEDYERARRAKTELFVEEIPQIARTQPDPNKARVLIDSLKWYASKMAPQKYGERIDLNVNQTVDIGAALTEAKRRAVAVRSQRIVEDAELVETKQLPLKDATGSEPVRDSNCEVSQKEPVKENEDRSGRDAIQNEWDQLFK